MVKIIYHVSSLTISARCRNIHTYICTIYESYDMWDVDGYPHVMNEYHTTYDMWDVVVFAHVEWENDKMPSLTRQSLWSS